MRTHARPRASVAAQKSHHRRGRLLATASFIPALGAVLVPAAFLGLAGFDAAEAKTPGKTYCYYGKCHRVKTIAETAAMVGTEETISASFYDSCDKDGYNPCGLTSSGEVYRPDAADNAASPVYPDGTTLLVWSPSSGASVVLRVNNAGPYWGNRKLDVSRATAQVLGFAGQGVGTLKVRVLSAPTVEEATYKARRRYDPVPGYIGRFASLDAALAGAGPAFAVAALGTPLTTPAPQDALKAEAAPAVVAAASAPAAETKAVTGSVAAVAPVRTASVVAVAEADAKDIVPDTPRVAHVAHKATVRVAAAEPKARSRNRTRSEHLATRNSRSVRVASRKAKEEKRVRVAQAAAPPERPPLPRSVVTLDGTNDMSVFTRHTYAGMERLAPSERVSQSPMRRDAYSSVRYAERDRDDG